MTDEQLPLHPAERELARRWGHADEGTFYPDSAIEALLRAEKGTKEYALKVLKARETLFTKYEREVVRVVGECGSRGFRIASPDERVSVNAAEREARYLNAIRKQTRALAQVDPARLSPRGQELRDRQLIRAGFHQACERAIESGKVLNQLVSPSTPVDPDRMTLAALFEATQKEP